MLFLNKYPKIKSFLKNYVLAITPLKIPEIRVILLNRDVKKFLSNVKINGEVLDVGAQKAQYKKYVKAEKYLTLDIDPSHNPDICCDAHDIKSKGNRFGLVIATEVLEHCYNPQKVVNEIYRVLKPGGICFISVPFMYHYHIAPNVKDYYRISKDGLMYLFRNFKDIEIKSQGNRPQLIWDNINQGGLISRFLLNIFNLFFALINSRHSNYPLGYILVARKPAR